MLQSLRNDRRTVATSAMILFLARFLVMALVHTAVVSTASATAGGADRAAPRVVLICTAFGLRTLTTGQQSGVPSGEVSGNPSDGTAPHAGVSLFECPACAAGSTLEASLWTGVFPADLPTSGQPIRWAPKVNPLPADAAYSWRRPRGPPATG